MYILMLTFFTTVGGIHSTEVGFATYSACARAKQQVEASVTNVRTVFVIANCVERN